jgi:hypothetical protein
MVNKSYTISNIMKQQYEKDRSERFHTSELK